MVLFNQTDHFFHPIETIGQNTPYPRFEGRSGQRTTPTGPGEYDLYPSEIEIHPTEPGDSTIAFHLGRYDGHQIVEIANLFGVRRGIFGGYSWGHSDHCFETETKSTRKSAPRSATDAEWGTQELGFLSAGDDREYDIARRINTFKFNPQVGRGKKFVDIRVN